MPGTGRDIKVLIVRKEKSSKFIHTNYIDNEVTKLTARESEISKFPSTKVEANSFIESYIYGGIYFLAEASLLIVT
jgi:hypothetical protein